MPSITNISRYAAMNTYTPREGSVMISINDPCSADYMRFNNADIYHKIIKFEFLDIGFECESSDDGMAWFRITYTQADEIASTLMESLAEGRDVVVHCNTGLSRSGAVVSAGIHLGFTEVHSNRQPNLYVLHEVLRAIWMKLDFRSSKL